MVLLLDLDGDGDATAFGGRLALLLTDGDLWVEVLGGEALSDERLSYLLQATAGELLVVGVRAWRAGLGEELQLVASGRAGEGLQALQLDAADGVAVVAELDEVRGEGGQDGAALSLSLEL